MNFLQLLWVVSVALAAVSIVIMLALTVRRVTLMRQRRHDTKIRAELTPLILRYLDGDVALDVLREYTRGQGSELMGELVADLLYSVRGGDRENLIELLRRLGIIELHLSALQHRTATKRAAAIFGLSLVDDPPVLDRIRDLLGDPDPDVRLLAAQALSKHRAIGPVRVLVDKLQIGTVENSRVLRTIFRNLTRKHTDELVELLDDDVPAAAKILAIDALGRSGNFAVIDAISAMIAHDSEDVRVMTLRALAELEHPKALPTVMRGLDDEHAAVRATAATCAGRIGLTDTIPLLLKRLDDNSWWVRLRSAEALYKLGETGIKRLRDSASMSSEAARVAGLVLAEKESLA
ncbi:MAG: HEAT repeat domain-containing protein [Gammaproteobacteria bacterium]|nr:HEAT repeat domain-containing protein [Gammaproteobacteria bacterium]MDH3464851.1 HEAT repeat domain-containing protein [Gammaproteobacteria bacterium]